MRRFLLATAIAVCLTQPARAAIIVEDPTGLVQQIREFGQLLKMYEAEYGTYLTAIKQLEQEAQTAYRTGEMLYSMTQNPNLGAAMQLMGMAGLSNPFPVSPYAIQGLISGRTGISGIPAALNGFISGATANNRVYDCQDDSWACAQLRSNARGLDASQGAAMNLMSEISNHIPILNALRAQMATATTQAERDNLRNAVQTEQAWVQEQQVQLASVSILMQSQRDLRDQRDNEAMTRGIDSWLQQANASGKGILQ